jgi:hypothetical protein
VFVTRALHVVQRNDRGLWIYISRHSTCHTDSFHTQAYRVNLTPRSRIRLTAEHKSIPLPRLSSHNLRLNYYHSYRYLSAPHYLRSRWSTPLHYIACVGYARNLFLAVEMLAEAQISTCVVESSFLCSFFDIYIISIFNCHVKNYFWNAVNNLIVFVSAL